MYGEDISESETGDERFSPNVGNLWRVVNHLRAVAKAVGRLGDHHLAKSRDDDED